jgi:hypothetical protein
MKKWFCKSEGLDATTKIAVFTAGYCVAKKNQKILASVLPVAKGIQETIDNGADNEILNAVLKDAIASLVDRVSDDVVIQGAIAAVLAQLKIDATGAADLELSNAAIKDIIDSFIAGMSTPVSK